ncbi:hypothetical protein MRX96_010522 [Rhipicephalus microplus]
MLITTVCVNIVGASMSMGTPYFNNSSQTSSFFSDHHVSHRVFVISHAKYVSLTHVKNTLRLISIASGDGKGCDSHALTIVVHRYSR